MFGFIIATTAPPWTCLAQTLAASASEANLTKNAPRRYGFTRLIGKSTHNFPEISTLEYTKIYETNIPKIYQIYPNISKICKDIQDIQNTKRRQGRPARPGPGAYFCIFQSGIFRTHNADILSRTIQYELMRRTHMFKDFSEKKPNMINTWPIK